MRIMLTGASGLLGDAIQRASQRLGWSCNGLARSSFDLHYPMRLVDALSDCDVFIHAAANTNVEECEAYPNQCYQDNSLLTEAAATAAARCGARFVYISSTGVYGEHLERPYSEYDDIKPTTHHHRAKYLGELAALRSYDALVVRTGWLYGGKATNPKNFVARRIEEAAACDGFIQSNGEQRGNPTFVDDVAECLLALITDGQFGVFNCVNEGVASRADYVAEILKLARLGVEVKPSAKSAFKRLARVSNNESAVNLKLRQCGYAPMPAWQNSLARYMQESLSRFVTEATANRRYVVR
jgi:dTDP-4-dehydrorhamnose reductase